MPVPYGNTILLLHFCIAHSQKCSSKKRVCFLIALSYFFFPQARSLKLSMMNYSVAKNANSLLEVLFIMFMKTHLVSVLISFTKNIIIKYS